MKAVLMLLGLVGMGLAQNLETNRVLEALMAKRLAKRAEHPELFGCKDPECTQDMYTLVTAKGYPCEQHVVNTSDNYQLTIFRIQYGKNTPAAQQKVPKPVVFLQHGLLASSADWVINFPDQSLGFMLADEGFDVWMGNVRGNTYGMANTDPNFNPKGNSKQRKNFWSFSFDEMAAHDLPAMVEFALGTSGAANLAYIGHSQGTAIGFIQFSEQPEWAAAKINTFYALAPIAYMGHSSSPMSYIAPMADSGIMVKFLNYLFGYNEFLPSTEFMDKLCSLAPKALCGNVLSLIAGFDFTNMNTTRIPVYSSKSPAGTSAQNMIHFGQLIEAKTQLVAYNYLSNQANMDHYGTKTPKVYYINKITIPVGLFYGDTDIFADPRDVQLVQRDIQNVLVSQENGNMDHLDYVWGLNAAPEVYRPIIARLKAANGMM